MKNLFFFLFFSNAVFCQNNVKFYFIFEDSEISSSDIKRKMNFIIQNSDSKKISYDILHFSTQMESMESWEIDKNIVNYRPSKIGCEYNSCSNLSSIISLTKTDKSKLIVLEKNVECEFGIESLFIPNKDESILIERINQELVRLKKSDKTQSVYFLFRNNVKKEKPSLSFESEIVNAKESKPIVLSPKITGEIVSYQWSPAIGLSCTNCKNPEFIGSESAKYSLTVKDSSGCYTLISSIEVKVEKNCLCTEQLSKLEVVLGKLPIKKYEEKGVVKAQWDWRIVSNQSGGYVFDLVTNANCAKKFRLRVLRHNGGVIFDQYYSRDEVDKRSRNPYHEKFPENFVFRVDLSNYEAIEYIDDAENEPYFIVEISTIDDNGEECLVKKSKSPKLRFTKCN